MSEVSELDRLEAGRAAYARNAWPEAYGSSGARTRPATSPPTTSRRSPSRRRSGTRTSRSHRERAYATYLDDGDRVRAALMALTLRRENHAKLADSVAKGWLQRADHLLEGEPESLAHGYLALANGELPCGAERSRSRALRHRRRDRLTSRRPGPPWSGPRCVGGRPSPPEATSRRPSADGGAPPRRSGSSARSRRERCSVA